MKRMNICQINQSFSSIIKRMNICLMDLRFADDVFLFARSSAEIAALLDDLVEELKAVGLELNAAKTVVLTSQAQPAAEFVTKAGWKLKVKDRDEAQKWLGCMLCCSGRHDLDIDYHIQAATKAFFNNKGVLSDRSVAVKTLLNFFNKIVTPVATFAASHHTPYKQDLQKLAIVFRHLSSRVVGRPGALDWSRPCARMARAPSRYNR